VDHGEIIDFHHVGWFLGLPVSASSDSNRQPQPQADGLNLAQIAGWREPKMAVPERQRIWLSCENGAAELGEVYAASRCTWMTPRGWISACGNPAIAATKKQFCVELETRSSASTS